MLVPDSRITRKKFLEVSAMTLAGSLVAWDSHSAPRTKTIDVGVCASWEDSTIAQRAGCTFIEEGVGKILMPDKPEVTFRTQFDTLSQREPLSLRSFIYFLPGHMKAVGPEANHEAIINYAAIAFERARITGARTVVFGSGGARRVPDGFEMAKAKEQFVSLCKALAPLAEKNAVILAVEQLNRGETNFINTMQQAGEIIETVNHPHFKMVCDIYHALREDDPASEIIRYRDHIVHCHIAEKEERTPPGVKGDDFTPYFKALKKIKYKGGMSLECRWTNMEAQIPLAVSVIKDQYRKA